MIGKRIVGNKTSSKPSAKSMEKAVEESTKKKGNAKQAAAGAPKPVQIMVISDIVKLFDTILV